MVARAKLNPNSTSAAWLPTDRGPPCQFWRRSSDPAAAGSFRSLSPPAAAIAVAPRRPYLSTVSADSLNFVDSVRSGA
jgi:hypothetical protein